MIHYTIISSSDDDPHWHNHLMALLVVAEITNITV